MVRIWVSLAAVAAGIRPQKDRIDDSVLGLEVAGLAAVEAIIIAVLNQADVVLTLAEATIAIAAALVFGLVAKQADELVGHGDTLAEVAALPQCGKCGM